MYLVQVGQNVVREDLPSMCVTGELQAHRAVLGGLFHLTRARPRRGTDCRDVAGGTLGLGFRMEAW